MALVIRANTLAELQARTTAALDRLAGQIASGALTLPEFVIQAEETLSFAHSRAAVLGSFRAKRHNPPSDVAIHVAGQAIFEQQQFLLNFARDLAEGKYRPKAQGGKGARQRMARFALYSLRLAGTANQAWLDTLRAESGTLEVRWILGSPREHCSSCRQEASIGWREAWTLSRVPGDGSTQCMVRCRCRLETREGAQSYAL